jgi:hypothetical protein
MATWMYAGTSVRRARERRIAIGRWREADERTPALRLPRRSTATASPATPPTAHGAEPAKDFSLTAPLPTIRLERIHARPLMPYALRTTACPYIESRSRDRRCLTDEPREVTLNCQAVLCLRQQHRRCPRYRKARGLRTLPPQRLAAYTVALALVVTLILVAGLQATRSDPGPSSSSSHSRVQE